MCLARPHPCSKIILFYLLGIFMSNRRVLQHFWTPLKQEHLAGSLIGWNRDWKPLAELLCLSQPVVNALRTLRLRHHTERSKADYEPPLKLPLSIKERHFFRFQISKIICYLGSSTSEEYFHKVSIVWCVVSLLSNIFDTPMTRKIEEWRGEVRTL